MGGDARPTDGPPHRLPQEKLKAKMHEREEARQEAQRQREEKKARKHDALTRFR